MSAASDDTWLKNRYSDCILPFFFDDKQSNSQQEDSESTSFCTKWIFPLFYFIMSFISFQWIRPQRKTKSYDWGWLSPTKYIPICQRKFLYETLSCIISDIMLITSIPAVAINIYPLVMFIIGWAECPYTHSSICYTLQFHFGENKIIPKLVLRDIPKEQNLEYNETKHELQEFVDLSKISLLFSTTANAVSHILFMWALWVLYIKHNEIIKNFFQSTWGLCKKWCCGGPGQRNETLPLDPFNDESAEEDLPLYDIEKPYKKLITKESDNFFGIEDDRTNTPLQGERLCHYITWLIIGLSILITTIVVFFTYQYHDAKNDNPMDYDDDFKMHFWLQMFTLILHANALFRSLVSCFIFSKLMYGIQRRCEELELYVYHISEIYLRQSAATSSGTRASSQPGASAKYVNQYLRQNTKNTEMRNFADNATITNSNAKKYLKKRDENFVKKALATLNWLQLWFLLHWLLHIISTFMVMTVLIDAIALHVKAKVPHLEPGVDFHPGEIGFLFMYSLLQCFFLFYPCLRAASVTRTRQRVIREISKKAKDKYSNIPTEVLNEFIESMKRHRFSFRLRILCARIPFNMNIAYLSIAFGFVGVVVSLITTVTN